MDKTIRRNEHCIIGQARCDFVFSSTRSSFIGFGFKESSLEMNILRHLLAQRGIEPVEASGSQAPGQNAFCVKICSKIITSQFCILLLNNDQQNDIEIPNANVNMEYGLMLGFNKYVLPFQRDTQKLPFNVAGLDTFKYTSENFEAMAASAIDKAIENTQQKDSAPMNLDQYVATFLLANKALIASIRSEGDRNIFELGSPFGFNLLTDFSGATYIYLGNFTALLPEVVIWRLRMLEELLQERFKNIPERVKLGLATKMQAEAAKVLQKKMKVWVIVTTDADKAIILQSIKKYTFPFKIYSSSDVKNVLARLDSQIVQKPLGNKKSLKRVATKSRRVP